MVPTIGNDILRKDGLSLFSLHFDYKFTPGFDLTNKQTEPFSYKNGFKITEQTTQFDDLILSPSQWMLLLIVFRYIVI